MGFVFCHYIYFDGYPIQVAHDMHRIIPNFQDYFDPYGYANWKIHLKDFFCYFPLTSNIKPKSTFTLN